MDRIWNALRRWRDWANGSHKCGFKILVHVKRSTFMPVRMRLEIKQKNRFSSNNNRLLLSVFIYIFMRPSSARFICDTHTHTPTTTVPRDSDGNSYSRHINLQLTYSFQNNSHHSLHMNNNNNNNNTSTTNNNNINNNNSTNNNNSINGNNNSTKSSLFTSAHGKFSVFSFSSNIFPCLFFISSVFFFFFTLNGQLFIYQWSNETKSANESPINAVHRRANERLSFVEGPTHASRLFFHKCFWFFKKIRRNKSRRCVGDSVLFPESSLDELSQDSSSIHCMPGEVWDIQHLQIGLECDQESKNRARQFVKIL